ncbi:MAG: FIG000325: clustered with transcription termination protein NusA [uncultured Thiotrichaceae bacterium]|uniref:Ribosome maturation factor RimP n=1 Tax=uncultured Thiotrichaceae bacterium TaxID=298394 RepID=A0A6S6SFR3_9GAMM|nr:MAG: FIG000325: clustered with transcription termination protein NusA [uncultured Thiotrichaceae bacterium]
MSLGTLENLITTTVEGLGYELWGYEYRPHSENGLLRIYIESTEGITVDDCASVSNQISAVFDVEDPIPMAYILEVSSPGMDRMLFKPEQYTPYVGETVKIKTQYALDGRRNYKGIIQNLSETAVTLEIDKELHEVPFDAIEHSRLKIAEKQG